MPTNLLLKKTDKPQTAPPLPPKEALPTMYDLPSENPDEPGLADDFHSCAKLSVHPIIHLSDFMWRRTYIYITTYTTLIGINAPIGSRWWMFLDSITNANCG